MNLVHGSTGITQWIFLFCHKKILTLNQFLNIAFHGHKKRLMPFDVRQINSIH